MCYLTIRKSINTAVVVGRHEAIAYAGRVPVRVVGNLAAGDRVTVSGLQDGTAKRANTPHQPILGTVLLNRTWADKLTDDKR